MTQPVLGETDLRFINLVAARKFHDTMPDEPSGLAGAVEAAGAAPTAFGRAAALAAQLVERRVFGTAASETALLALTCQLARDGFDLVAPQGTVVGMIRGLAGGSLTETTLVRWLEDRAVSRTP